MANDYSYIKKDNSITMESIGEWNLGINMVLVKPAIDTSVIGDKVKISIDTYFGEIENSTRVVEVVKVPEKLAIKGQLHYNENFHSALDWETDQELKVGDIAWVDPLAVVANNNTETNLIHCNGQIYYLIRYDKFIAVQRGSYKFTVNGYVLLERLREDPKEPYQVFEQDSGKSIVKFIGNPNTSYYNKHYTDDFYIQKEDVVENPRFLIPLEDSLHRVFHNTDLYCTQRRNITLKYNRI